MNRGTVKILGPKTREEKVIYDDAYGELRRLVILRELCRDELMTETDPDERVELVRHIDLACTSITRYRTVLDESVYPVTIDAKLRADMRRLRKKWSTIIAAEIAAEGWDGKEGDDAEEGGDGSADLLAAKTGA